MKLFSPIFYGIHNTARLFLAILLFAITHQADAQTDIAPVVTATGNQDYCPGTPLNIVTSFTMTDADDATAQGIYIQISSGYVSGQDMLSLSITLPNVISTWNATAGLLTIKSANGQELDYATLINAVENVVYTNSAATPTGGTRTFSITPGDANYLPSTGHYYRFISQQGITWTASKTAAENTTYYGLQGYLATLITADESQLCGEQATGTGWIGGSDAAQEGVWKWVTGPEAGITFWNGGVNGASPNFAFWNNSEPNNQGDEDYAHITAPGTGILGSWNDLPNIGSNGVYVPKGYIVEFGGMPGDPVLQISASTTINVARLTGTTPAQRCGDGTLTLQGVSTGSIVYWYDAPSAGNLLSTGSSFTTPSLSQTTTYYASAYPPGCTTGPRTAVAATINIAPTLTVDAAAPVCSGTAAQLTATASAGIINWYNTATGGNILGTGTSFNTPILTADTTFYAEAINNGCPATSRQAVTVTVLPVPAVNDETVEFCEKSTAAISAGLPGMAYEWSTGAETESISIRQAGTYTVTITNAAGCSTVKTITAVTLPAPDIIRVEVNSGTATIIMAGGETSGYEYAIDGGSYKASNVFTNLSPGQHTAYARSVNGCGNDTKLFAVYMIPQFFTPNGDSINDVFTLSGMGAFPQATVNIFDRYGKVITVLSSSNRSWDGTFAGNRLPATDYWYVIKLDNETPEIKGHFSLIR